MAYLLWDSIFSWARIIQPGLCIALDDDKTWLGRELLYEAEFRHISIGWIGSIHRPAIQKYFVHSARLQFRRRGSLGAGRDIPIRMQLLDDNGIFLPPVRRNPHISVVGLTVTSDTLKAPRKGWPLRLSSFFEMLKQGTPLIEVTSASAMRERAQLFMLETASRMNRVL
ncbi:hypothetical protein KIV45_07740 [Janthinobacterium lividum]|nr:hypothetical protein KIV45_07740 [Janthinobacterium lividum]